MKLSSKKLSEKKEAPGQVGKLSDSPDPCKLHAVAYITSLFFFTDSN